MQKLIEELIIVGKKYGFMGFTVATNTATARFVVRLKDGTRSTREDGYYLEATREDLMTQCTNKLFGDAKRLADDYVFSDEVRKELIALADRDLKHIKKYAKEVDLGEFFGNLKENQDKVRAEYIYKYELTEDEANTLHMFFSPNRIVRGLTESEVRMCILLAPYRDEQKDFYSIDSHPRLDPGLIRDIDSDISRTEAFNKAIRIMLEDWARVRSLQHTAT